jgi:hypothetical protein
VTDWRDEATCRGRPTSLWFSVDPFEQAVALAVCRTVPFGWDPYFNDVMTVAVYAYPIQLACTTDGS